MDASGDATCLRHLNFIDRSVSVASLAACLSPITVGQGNWSVENR